MSYYVEFPHDFTPLTESYELSPHSSEVLKSVVPLMERRWNPPNVSNALPEDQPNRGLLEYYHSLPGAEVIRPSQLEPRLAPASAWLDDPLARFISAHDFGAIHYESDFAQVQQIALTFVRAFPGARIHFLSQQKYRLNQLSSFLGANGIETPIFTSRRDAEDNFQMDILQVVCSTILGVDRARYYNSDFVVTIDDNILRNDNFKRSLRHSSACFHLFALIDDRRRRSVTEDDELYRLIGGNRFSFSADRLSCRSICMVPVRRDFRPRSVSSELDLFVHNGPRNNEIARFCGRLLQPTRESFGSDRKLSAWLSQHSHRLQKLLLVTNGIGHRQSLREQCERRGLFRDFPSRFSCVVLGELNSLDPAEYQTVVWAAGTYDAPKLPDAWLAGGSNELLTIIDIFDVANREMTRRSISRREGYAAQKIFEYRSDEAAYLRKQFDTRQKRLRRSSNV